MNNSVTIRGMTEGDLSFADSVRAIANWNQTKTDWMRLLSLNPTGCYVAEWNGSPAGTATTTRFGQSLAWIGMLLVHPDFRRRGVARALLQACVDHLADVRCIKLDATPLGKPLYDQFGFCDEYSLSRWELPCRPEEIPSNRQEINPRIRPLEKGSLDSIAELDKQAFGATRMELLESLIDSQTVKAFHEPRWSDILPSSDSFQAPESVRVPLSAAPPQKVEGAETGESSGYAMLRQGFRASYVGPIVAESAAIGERLINALDISPATGPFFWDIPDSNIGGTDLATRIGFIKQRPFMRMYRGTNIAPGIPAQCFGIIDPSLG
ncbi:MAG: GNAT family N-acetyltransferase [Verrucomicrobia bacterium]|nr:GNAT family N-acetyltransferase [Verrucomicrobiota bacterium]